MSESPESAPVNQEISTRDDCEEFDSGKPDDDPDLTDEEIENEEYDGFFG